MLQRWHNVFCLVTRLLQDKPPGTFIVRDSTTYSGAFGLAVKVDQVPDHILAKGGEHVDTCTCMHTLQMVTKTR
jgi:hypothetical protein